MGFGLGIRSRVLEVAAGVHKTVPEGVALTFDDGPVPGATDHVLDTLAVLSLRATFFCVGRNASRHPSLVHRIIDEGHAIGSHSFSHAPKGEMVGRVLVQDYVDGRRAVEDVSGRAIPLFRPPYGYLSLRTAAVLRSFDTWTWTVDPEDYRAAVTAEEIARAVGGAQEGDVALMHDWIEQGDPAAQNRSATIHALAPIAASLGRSALRTVALRECPRELDRPGS